MAKPSMLTTAAWIVGADGGSDLALRSRVDREVHELRTQAADWLAEQVRTMRATGHAAMTPGARSQGRATR
jgi:hypothetical protein